MTVVLELNERARLRQFLVDRFSLDELKDLAFDLGVDFQLFSHETKRKLSRELIAHFEHKEKLSCLVTEVIRRRHDNELAQLLTKLPPCSPLKRLQIIVAEDLLDLTDVPKLTEELAIKFKVAKDEVVLIGAAWGSVRLLVGIPEEVADLRIASEIRSLGDGKYQVVSIDFYDSLGSASQKAWRLVARDKPPVRQGNALRPTISWEEALEATREAPPALHTTPAERLQRESLPTIEQSLATLQAIREHLGPEIASTHLHVKVINRTNIYCRIARADDMMLATKYLCHSSGSTSPTLGLHGKDTSWFRKFANEFDHMWELAADWPSAAEITLGKGKP